MPSRSAQAARQLEPHDLPLALGTYLEAIDAAMVASPHAACDGQFTAAEAAWSGPPAKEPLRPADLLLDGITTLIIEGHGSGVSRLRRALEAFQGPDLSADEGLRWLWLVNIVSASLWDLESCVCWPTVTSGSPRRPTGSPRLPSP
ncbi:hypothetical protein [Streptomyces sp. NPDC086010]|uniref:hypothetical protein n=1 Tax=Streptomyces sp. NPDC086010 TaxID=3365745 RepID=UPI0037CF3449